MRPLALLLGGALACAAAGASAERLLVRAEGLSVHEAAPAACGAPVDLVVRGADSATFADDSPAFASAIDAARAMLLFECRSLGDIRVSGRLAARPDEEVYRGIAPASDGWRVASAFAAPPRAGAPAVVVSPMDVKVAGLALGMPLEDVRRVLARDFGDLGRFDESRRSLRAEQGGCRFDFSAGPPQAGWRCLDAGFSEGQPPALILLTLIQAVDGDQTADVVRQLEQRYGRPTAKQEQRRRQVFAGILPEALPVTGLGWGPEAAAGSGVRQYPLEAEVMVRDGVTVVALRLVDSASAVPSHRVRF